MKIQTESMREHCLFCKRDFDNISSLVMRFTVDGELDLPGGGACSVGGGADELSGLVSRRGGDEEAAVRTQRERRTAHMQQLPALYITTGLNVWF